MGNPEGAVRMVVIADKDAQSRDEIARLLGGPDFTVVTADSGMEVLRDVLEKDARVILLGNEFDDLPNRDLLPLLKGCRKDLTVILVSNVESLPLLRRLRREGIFFHALKPESKEDREELLEAVQCAFANEPEKAGGPRPAPGNRRD